MSYLVMARKWRPQTFDDLVGQAHISETLKKAIQTGRIAHAFLFCGTRGVGKTTTARILAKSLNCAKGPTPNPCGECAACTEITSGVSTDVVEIDGASNRGIEDIRSLQENIRYASMHGRNRVIIIDEVHMVTTPAFNALLKTLEEPPPNVIFIFATTEPMRIPQTILSRCQRYDFRRIPLSTIRERLLYICQQENVKAHEEALFLIAKKADGSMRDALSLLDQVLSFAQGEIALSQVQEILGLAGQEIYEKLVLALVQKDRDACLSVVEQIFSSGYDLGEFVSGLADQIRNLLLAKSGQSLKSLLPGLADTVLAFYQESSRSFSDGDLVRMASWVNTLTNNLRRSHFPRFEIELCLLKMIHADSTVSLSDLIERMESRVPLMPQKDRTPNNEQPSSDARMPIKKKPEPAVKEPPESASPAAPPSGDHQDLRVQWPALLDEVMQEKPILGTFLSHARIAGQSETQVEIRFPSNSGFQLEQMQKRENFDFVKSKIFKWIGRPLEVKLTAEEKQEKETAKAAMLLRERGSRKERISFDEAGEKEPILNKIMEMFNGKLVD